MSIRHEWYEKDDKVVLTVFLKNAVEKKYQCNILENSVYLTAENYELKLELLNAILPDKSTHKASEVKIEISLVKRDFGHWATLERKVKEEKHVGNITKKQPDEWEKLAKEIEKNHEEEEGDPAMNAMRKLYANAPLAQQQAMIKSYQESGGTVLSMNADEVLKKTTKISPPKGCEFRSWDS